MRRSRARVTARVAFAFAAAVLSITPAIAINSSATAVTTAVTSGSWLAAPVLTATSSNSLTSLQVTSLSTKKYSYFWVCNFGSYDLNGFTISQTVALTGGSPTVEIRSCSGVWDVVKDTCSGSVAILLTTSDGQTGSAPVPISVAVGSAVQLAAYPTRNGMQTAISVGVSRASIRAAHTLHG